jgi:hypothetical protein
MDDSIIDDDNMDIILPSKARQLTGKEGRRYKFRPATHPIKAAYNSIKERLQQTLTDREPSHFTNVYKYVREDIIDISQAIRATNTLLQVSNQSVSIATVSREVQEYCSVYIPRKTISDWLSKSEDSRPNCRPPVFDEKMLEEMKVELESVRALYGSVSKEDVTATALAIAAKHSKKSEFKANKNWVINYLVSRRSKEIVHTKSIELLRMKATQVELGNYLFDINIEYSF